jgi:hypothetical protein
VKHLTVEMRCSAQTCLSSMAGERSFMSKYAVHRVVSVVSGVTARRTGTVEKLVVSQLAKKSSEWPLTLRLFQASSVLSSHNVRAGSRPPHPGPSHPPGLRYACIVLGTVEVM